MYDTVEAINTIQKEITVIGLMLVICLFMLICLLINAALPPTGARKGDKVDEPSTSPHRLDYHT